MIKKQSGFTLVEGLLIILILIIVGFGGYSVWNRDKKSNDAPEQSTEISKKSEKTCDTKIESQKSWVIATSSKQSFSMCVPGGWILTSDPEANAFNIFPPFIINNDSKAEIKNETTGKDGSSDQLQIFSAEESYQGWTSNESSHTTFTLNDGTEGIRYYEKHENVGEGIGPLEGAEDYEYLLEKNGKFVHAVYTILPGTENHLETIEEVLKTLNIN